GLRLYGVAATVDPRSGQLVLSVVPVTAGQLVSRLARRLRRSGPAAPTPVRTVGPATRPAGSPTTTVAAPGNHAEPGPVQVAQLSVKS
ncbi:hypothetical protein JNW87_19765, partial [Micromonospora sp. ATA51]|nr:hypothetical protein [Micromonospora sp. ATA51]